MKEVHIEVQSASPPFAIDLLDAECQPLGIELIPLTSGTRSATFATEVVVAIIGSSSVVVGALVAGIMKILEKLKEQRTVVTLTDADDTKVHLELPGRPTKEDVVALVSALQQLSKPRLLIRSENLTRDGRLT